MSGLPWPEAREKNGALIRLAWTYILRKNGQRGRKTFGRAKENNARDRMMHMGRWVLRRQRGRHEQARRKLTTFMENRGKTVQKQWLNKLVRYLSGDVSEKKILRAVRDHPRNRSVVQCWIGINQELNGRRERALRAYRAAVDTGVTTSFWHTVSTLRLQALSEDGPLLLKTGDEKK